jgi:uncharacterized damage-inducible protein DinB
MRVSTLSSMLTLAMATAAPLAAQASVAARPAVAAVASTPAGFRAEFLDQFNSSMSKFVALARAMPADRFAWSPADGVMPVAQVYAHVAHYNFNYPVTAMGVPSPAGVRLDTLEKVADKAQVVALLQQSGTFVRESVARMSDEQLARPTTLYGREVPQWAVLFQLLAHMNEHLGQSIAYARSNGVVPPWSK